MANTEILLTPTDGILTTPLTSVSVVSGDMISFSTSDGSAAFLFFSPDTIKVLSPAPASTPFQISSKASFSFTSSEPGTYSVYFETKSSATPPPFPSSRSTSLQLEIDPTGANFGTSDTGIKRGR